MNDKPSIYLVPNHRPNLNDNDYPWWGEYLCEVEDSDFENNEILPLYNIVLMNPWHFLKECGISLDIDKITYKCPYSNLSFYGVMPFAILSKDIKKYRKGKFESEIFDISWDDKWTRDMDFKGYGKNKYGSKLVSYKVPEIPILDAQLGHGYDNSRLHTDGSGRIVEAKAELSNGDWLIVKTWLWFNK